MGISLIYSFIHPIYPNQSHFIGSLYGHVKLSDSYTSNGGAASSAVGASSQAVYNCYVNLNNSLSNISSKVGGGSMIDIDTCSSAILSNIVSILNYYKLASESWISGAYASKVPIILSLYSSNGYNIRTALENSGYTYHYTSITTASYYYCGLLRSANNGISLNITLGSYVNYGITFLGSDASRVYFSK